MNLIGKARWFSIVALERQLIEWKARLDLENLTEDQRSDLINDSGFVTAVLSGLKGEEAAERAERSVPVGYLLLADDQICRACPHRWVDSVGRYYCCAGQFDRNSRARPAKVRVTKITKF